MAGITLADAELQLAEFLNAAQACAANQEYQIAGQRYRRADLHQIMLMIDFFDKKCKTLSRKGAIRSVGVTVINE